MGSCVGKQDNGATSMKQLNKISNQLLKARRIMFRFLKASDKIEQKLEKIDAKADMQLIQKQMEQYEGQYDYQSFINSFDILTQIIQRSKNIIQNAYKNQKNLENIKVKSIIEQLNQYLSIFVLETSEDYQGDEGRPCDQDSPQNNISPQQLIQEFSKNQQSENLNKPSLIAQQSINEIHGLSNNTQQINPRMNSKSLGVANTTCILKDDTMACPQRKRGASTKASSKITQNMDLNSIDLLDYNKNSSIINRQRNPSRQKSYTVYVIDGQIKIQQQLTRIDLITSDSQIY
ncbi:hypothetical protein TTHERM_00420800 (macronuclear) [Tetrahymena thermophila SB210]|uniref:Uncharacterized protein n=1 Tax=Tetrahymena thermophila (strain SB210) TaxID=312017 RepID=I7MH14_TETTS|nr:hypothetical protein TTHERM_00420800 [Tetrahymena thermophila SB210]EAR85672.1 hypothetical protein TTHERM_00420800 [Tetrahymena thermophila SB210]|eukprot:XP_001033335.1 hypothetical protein TTHERM_00420800 [Tetrahymena thermophila SB210]